MTDDKSLVPKLRFPGFTGAWERRKLGDTAVFLKGRGYSKKDLKKTGDPIILYGRLYTDYETIISSIHTYVDRKANSVFSKGGEIIVPASGETADDIARASVIEKSGIIIGGDLNVVRLRRSLVPSFIAREISNGSCQRELSQKAQGKSIVHIHSSDLQGLTLTFPCVSEQHQIDTFFKQLDDLIALYQRKLSHLEQLKKGLLQKMFPKPGEAYPEIRFPGFTGAWQQRKLNKIADIVTGFTPSTNRKDYYDGDYPFVSPADIQGNRYVETTLTTLSEEGFNVGRIIGQGASLFVSIGSTIGKVAQAFQPLVTNQQINSVISRAEFDDDFIFTSLEFKAPIIKQLASTQAVPIINKTTFGETSIWIPKQDEQKKIGAFFFALDDLVALYQRKLSHLQQLKKALLQQMFV